MGFQRILCPTDFSAGSDHALHLAARMAMDHGGELVLVHALDIPQPALTYEVSYPPEVIKQLGDDAKHMLDHAVATARQLGASRVRGELVSGVPWSAIVDLAERQGVDLCVISTQGSSGLSRVLLGSVAERVVRHAPCSVMAVHPKDKLKLFSHALVPFDFSPSARHAVSLVTDIVDTPGAITLLHVLQLPARFSGEVPTAAFSEEMNKRAATLLQREAAALAKLTPHKVETRLRIGYAGHELLKVLDEDPSYDVIVMGSRGNTGIKRVLLGSVAEKTVRHARCPVLVVRLPTDATNAR